ncbi:raffinose/stachyose/melibiose transport system substrate-binding protein [Paenibacillus endophyticus]|uniref:Raffinose/stachyose/melibiose transport system substrate-binding protein n=1 Tax=Paenibacillus endophyticus TaxID=1294268 RepID=A0A7W5C8L6_9BACL|nr:extracellular solute-binding protein [Paenibacillus endophyticus]MBB3153138.1 raffinose/stachyose/melibiose transport system substrate-binding protein [Paenibacillus endophyticus]
MKKKLVLGLATAILAMSLSACGSEETDDGNSGEAAQKVELKVQIGSPRFKDQFEKYFEQFKAKELAEKNIDVTIDLEMPNPDQAKQVLQARLASNDAPDIFDVHANDLNTYDKAGYLEDLTGQPATETLYETVKNTVMNEGRIMALPLESLSWGYLYNKEIFNELGLTPPQTLDEMKEVVMKLNEADKKPFLLAFQESWVPQLMTALTLGGLVSSEHQDWIEKMNKGEASYADVSDIFNIIDLIMENGTAKPFEVGNEAGSTEFANGKAAMWVQGPWNAETILKVNPDMEFGVAPLPVSNNAAGTMINLSTSTTLAVSKTSKNKEVALDLLNYFYDAKDSSALFQELKFNPVSSVHQYEVFPWVNEASEYVAKGKAYQDLKLPNGVTDEQAKLLQSYFAKEVNKEQFISSMDKAWATAIKSAQ